MTPFLLLAFLAPLATAPQDEEGPVLTSGRPAPPEQTCYDVTGYSIALRVDPADRSILGTVTVEATLLNESEQLILDLDDRLEVTRVESVVTGGWGCSPEEPGDELEFTHTNGEIRFETPPTPVGGKLLIRVSYGGRPRVAPRPPWDGGFVWAKTPSGKPWIATCNQMQGADLWFPCKDQPDDEADHAFIQISVPEPLVVASNGRQAGLEKGFDVGAFELREGWNNHQWVVSTPINTYGIALNIAPYETITREVRSRAGDTFPVTYWVLPENLEKGKVLFEDILRQLEYFETVFGPYPFRGDKYGVAETPYLGMEHQTIIAYGNEYRGDRWGEDRGYDELHLHEFAHEWWANLVTAKNWKDFWIHESFATYAQALYAQRVGGREAYDREMAEQRSFLNRAAIAPREPRSTAEMYFGDRPGSPGGDIYYKGSWVLHTLRWLMWDEQFIPMLRRMAYPVPELEKKTDGSACRFATTEELIAIAEEFAGEDLGWFFDVYLRQPALPVLDWKVEDGVLLLEWDSPAGRPFPMPVEVWVGGRSIRVDCPEGKGRLDLRGNTEFQVDPQNRVLRRARER